MFNNTQTTEIEADNNLPTSTPVETTELPQQQETPQDAQHDNAGADDAQQELPQQQSQPNQLETQPAQNLSFADFAAAIAEAEERGYRRGCASVQQQQPAENAQKPIYQMPETDNSQNNSTPTFLSHIRSGFWD
jgi:hypothetical protein